MKPLRLFSTLALSAVIALCAATAWKLRTAENAAPANRAWGNVETRQTSLAFEASGRIAALHKEEGESVQAGELLGQLDDEALRIGRRQAAAELLSASKHRQRSRMKALVRKILTQLAPMKQQLALSSNTLRPRLNGSRIWFPLAPPAARCSTMPGVPNMPHANL